MQTITEKTESNFLLRSCSAVFYIDYNRILHIEAVSNYSKIYFVDGKTMVVAKVLHLFEDKLPMQQFVRTHRKHLVNKRFIESYENGKVSLVNLQKIDVARRKKMQFLNSWLNTKAS
jgi:DNA-binding LytR/AlgR family response regulator